MYVCMYTVGGKSRVVWEIFGVDLGSGSGRFVEEFLKGKFGEAVSRTAWCACAVSHQQSRWAQETLD